MERLTIAGREIGDGRPPYVIAELGANHNGDMALCARLIDAAQDAGADAVKFQSWTRQSLISSAEYERDTRYAGARQAPSLAEAVERYQMTPDRLREAAAHCASRGMVWFASCFSAAEVELLESLDAPAYKIASMDVNHLPLLRRLGATGKPMLLSTGMATLGEVERALDTLRESGAGSVAVLHCLSLYPSPPELVNLRMLATWRQAFDVPVGYSDHTLGIAVPLAAAALGACLIEKHFTLDRTLEGWDHAISADPAELAALVQGCRDVFHSLGSGARMVGGEELTKRRAFRRGMVAARALSEGDCIEAGDVDFKRPGTGIRPDELQYVLGRTLRRAVSPDEELAWTDLR
jgi:N,N'-diacetyllegionaminate synthase